MPTLKGKPDSKDNVLLTVHWSGPAMFLLQALRLMQVILSKNFQFSNSIRISGWNLMNVLL